MFIGGSSPSGQYFGVAALLPPWRKFLAHTGGLGAGRFPWCVHRAPRTRWRSPLWAVGAPGGPCLTWRQCQGGGSSVVRRGCGEHEEEEEEEEVVIVVVKSIK